MLQTRVGEMEAELSYTRTHIEQMLGMMQQLLQAKSADGGQQKIGHAAPAGETQTMAAAAPEGQRAKKGPLAQELVPQQKLLQGEKCLATAAERRMDQDLPTIRIGDQKFQLTWVRRSTCSAVKLEIHFLPV